MRALKVFCVGIVVLTVAFFAGGNATTDSKATGGDKATGGGNTTADELRNPVEVRSVKGVCDIVLEAAVREHPFPAATGAGGPYKLRSPVYILRKVNQRTIVGDKKDDGNCLVGPTIRIRKGHKLRILVQNRLDPRRLPAEVENPPDDYPQGYASTNLHTHGLHVSPKGKADNIYVEIKPGEDHQFEYQILRNHPAGTFWYHPHKHGSVAIQLTGGMAGALIVDEDKEDDLFPDLKEKPAEKIMVLQQVHGVIADAITNPRLLTCAASC